MVINPSAIFGNVILPAPHFGKISPRTLGIVKVAETTAGSGTTDSIKFVAVGHCPGVVLVEVHVSVIVNVLVHYLCSMNETYE